MSTVRYVCGCYITCSMYGEREVRDVGHCQRHWHLFSQHKSLYQMAEEIRALTDTNQPPDLGVHVAEIVEHQEKLA